MAPATPFPIFPPAPRTFGWCGCTLDKLCAEHAPKKGANPEVQRLQDRIERCRCEDFSLLDCSDCRADMTAIAKLEGRS